MHAGVESRVRTSVAPSGAAERAETAAAEAAAEATAAAASAAAEKEPAELVVEVVAEDGPEASRPGRGLRLLRGLGGFLRAARHTSAPKEDFVLPSNTF